MKLRPHASVPLTSTSLPPSAPTSGLATAAPSSALTKTTKDGDGVDPVSVAALRSSALGGEGPTKRRPEERPVGAVQASVGARLLGGASKLLSSMTTGVRVAMIGLSLLSASPTTASADTVFLDHNNAPKEIAVARDLARSKGEPFVLVRPDAASLDSLFARAERGDVDIRHLIISGHSTGKFVWGEGANGTPYESSIEQYKELKAKYPKAFQQVRHVTFMSCYSGSVGNSAQWAGVFEKARVISGFFGSGPSKDQPAAHQMLKHTELLARAVDKRPTLSPQQALLTAKSMARQPGTNVTLFAVRVDGVHHARGQRLTPVEQAHDRVSVLQSRAYEPFFHATAEHESPPTNRARSALRDYYSALHAYQNALPAQSPQLGEVSARIQTTIRLIYFDVVVARFQHAHAATLDGARAEAATLGITIATDLTKLSRAEILRLTDTLMQTSGVRPDGALQKLRVLLHDGLKELKPTVIPSTWIG
jgi:hypothetical protein